MKHVDDEKARIDYLSGVCKYPNSTNSSSSSSQSLNCKESYGMLVVSQCCCALELDADATVPFVFWVVEAVILAHQLVCYTWRYLGLKE